MTEGPENQPAAVDPAVGPGPGVHLIARISSEEERDTVQAWLAEQRLDPQVEWTTSSSVSFRLNTTDDRAVSELMRGLRDTGWTVVPSGQPDYLLRQLFVEGPDGRRFRISDVPAATPIGTLAAEVIDQYRESGVQDRPMIVDRVDPSGESRRVNPDWTLASEGVIEGEQLRVGFQATAG